MFCPELKNLNISGNVQIDAKHVIKILMNHPKRVWANVLGSALFESDDTYDCLLAMPNIKVFAMTLHSQLPKPLNETCCSKGFHVFMFQL